jgi:uncharacterized protein (DUF2384 family)
MKKVRGSTSDQSAIRSVAPSSSAAEIQNLAASVIGSRRLGETWLRTPALDFNGKRQLDLLDASKRNTASHTRASYDDSSTAYSSEGAI